MKDEIDDGEDKNGDDASRPARLKTGESDEAEESNPDLKGTPVHQEETEYLARLEKHLCEHGLNFRLTSKGNRNPSFKTAQQWYHDKISLACVLKAIDTVIEAVEQSMSMEISDIGSLAYFGKAVLKEYAAFQEQVREDEAIRRSIEATNERCELMAKQIEAAKRDSDRYIPPTLELAAEHYGLR